MHDSRKYIVPYSNRSRAREKCHTASLQPCFAMSRPHFCCGVHPKMAEPASPQVGWALKGGARGHRVGGMRPNCEENAKLAEVGN